MDRVFSMEEISEPFWAPHSSESQDPKMNRSSSEWAFQRFLQEAAAVSENLASASSVSALALSSSSCSRNNDGVVVDEEVIEVKESPKMPGHDVPIDSDEYQEILKRQLNLACAAVALTRASGVIPQDSASLADNGSKASDTSQLGSQNHSKGSGNGVSRMQEKAVGGPVGIPALPVMQKNPVAAQIRSTTSGSSREQSDDDELEVGTEATENMDPTDAKRVRRSDFPSLANPSGRGSKGIPGKGTFGGTSSRLKSSGSKPAEYSLSSSPASTESSLKGRRNAITKHKEAMDFKDWCESESVRLMGTKDTSFLEFCSKQPTSEAKILMTENLGSFDPNHEFIEKFLNYKELLSSDVIEIAFQVRNDRTVTTGFGIGDVNTTDTTVAGDFDPDMTAGLDGPTKGGGKKKGRKGKKVSPSVLGFNVVSNRIMMGEIQTVED